MTQVDAKDSRRNFGLPCLALVLPVTMTMAFLSGTAAAASLKVDVIVLKNGTSVVGELLSMKRGRLSLKTDDMSTIQIEWDKIVRVTAPELFEVEDMNGRLQFGSLKPSADGTGLLVSNILNGQPLLLENVSRIQLVKSKFWDRISGVLDLGASYVSASELLQVDLDGEIRFRRPKFELGVEANAVTTRQPDVDDTRRGSVTLSYMRLFSNGQRVLAKGAIEQNRELGFEWRSSFTGAWAAFLARNTGHEFVGGAGFAVNHEVPVEGEETSNVEATVGFSYAKFAYDFPNIDIQVGANAYVGLNQWGRFRMEGSARLSREIVRDFYLGLKGYESYDSDPATEGAQKNDWGLTASIGWRF